MGRSLVGLVMLWGIESLKMKSLTHTQNNWPKQLTRKTMDTAFETLSQDLSDIITRTSRSIVAIRGRRSAGTGIHWRQGLVVTSCEALNEGLNTGGGFKLSLPDGQTVDSELVGADATTDVAVLALPEGIDLPLAVTGDAKTLAMGQLVSSVGYSMGRGRRSRLFSALGMVSQVGDAWRSQSGGHVDQYIEVDLRIRRGSAGCPLINHSGQVVGFNTFGPRRKVLTIPAATVTAVVDQLQQRGKISKGYLGLGMQAIPLPENVRSQHNLTNEVGIMVISVEPNSAADTAGMVIGDVMVALGNETLENLRQVQTFLGPQSVGQPLSITLLRGGQLQTVTVTVGER
ncbi:MAG: S1C family serine protease [Cyanobacteria bacterium J06598_1]